CCVDVVLWLSRLRQTVLCERWGFNLATLSGRSIVIAFIRLWISIGYWLRRRRILRFRWELSRKVSRLSGQSRLLSRQRPECLGRSAITTFAPLDGRDTTRRLQS